MSSETPNPVDWTALKFFGLVSACMSHELRNACAVIHENAGLLDDLVALSRRGVPFDPVRFSAVSGRVSRHVDRAIGLVGCLNRFAHSVDMPVKSIDLAEAVKNVLELCGRLIAGHDRPVRLDESDGPISLTSSPFLLEVVVWHLLEASINTADKETGVTVAPERVDKGPRLRFTPNPSPDAAAEVTEHLAPLLDALGAEIDNDIAGGQLVLLLPDTIPTEP